MYIFIGKLLFILEGGKRNKYEGIKVLDKKNGYLEFLDCGGDCSIQVAIWNKKDNSQIVGIVYNFAATVYTTNDIEFYLLKDKHFVLLVNVFSKPALSDFFDITALKSNKKDYKKFIIENRGLSNICYFVRFPQIGTTIEVTLEEDCYYEFRKYINNRKIIYKYIDEKFIKQH